MVNETKNIEVSGALVTALVDSLPEAFRAAPLAMLAAHGLVPPFENRWFDTESLSNFMSRFAEAYGPNTIFNIGKKIPAVLLLPPKVADCDSISDIPEAVDKIFHLYHRRDGQILYDAENDRFFEGLERIRHRKTGPNTMELTALHLYPPELTRGIIVRLARKFDPLINVQYEIKDGEALFTVVWDE